MENILNREDVLDDSTKREWHKPNLQLLDASDTAQVCPDNFDCTIPQTGS